MTAALSAVVAGPESTIDELSENGQEVIVEVSGSGSGRVHRVGTAEAASPSVDSGEENGGGDG